MPPVLFQIDMCNTCCCNCKLQKVQGFTLIIKKSKTMHIHIFILIEQLIIDISCGNHLVWNTNMNQTY